MYDPGIELYGGVFFSPNRPDPDNITKMDMGALPMVRDFHHFGIRLDVPLLNSISAEITERKREIESLVDLHIGAYQYVHAKTGVRTPFKIGSRDHLSQLLFEELKVQGDAPVPLTEKGARFEVSEEILKPFIKNHPIVGPIIEWHSADKIDNTYAHPLPLKVDSNSRLHTQFNTTVAATGRLSSSNPNLQNIPVRTKLGKRIRQAFIARQGWTLVSSDFAQIEMVWAAHRSQDPTMMSVFHNREDLHTRTACNVFHLDYADTDLRISKVDKDHRLFNSSYTPTVSEIAWYKHFKQFQRLPCKTVGFGLLYGQTPEGLQASLAADGVFWTTEECLDLANNKFFAVYPGLQVMLEKDYTTVKRYGMIWDDFGRVRLVPEAKSHLKWIAQEGIRKAGNHPEQGSAQGSAKLAMAQLTPITRAFGPDIVCPLLQIHDQLIFEVRNDFATEVATLMRQEMESATPLSVPVRASSDIGDRWSDL